MWKKLTSAFGRKLNKLDPASVRVVYGQKTYNVTFDDDDYVTRDNEQGVTLGFLRERLEQLLGKPVDIYQLRPKRKLVDDDYMLADLEIYTDDRLLAIAADKGPVAGTKLATPPPPPPKTPRQQIEEVVDYVESNIKPHIDSFMKDPPKDAASREDAHRRLGETILQNMLKLDDVDTGGDDELRQLRKSAINKMHEYHGLVDEAYSNRRGTVNDDADDAKTESEPNPSNNETAA